MSHRIALLLLLAGLPMMIAQKVVAAPAPEVCAILDIGPPPKGKSAEEHRKREIGHLPYYYIYLLQDSEVKKLPIAASLKKGPAWLEKQLRVTVEENRRLRISFQAGTRAEQVAVLNTLLREYRRLTVTERIPKIEKTIRYSEEGAPRLAKLLKEEQ